MTVLIGLTIILVLMLSESEAVGHAVAVGSGVNALLLVACVLAAPLFALLPVCYRKTLPLPANDSVQSQLPRWLIIGHMTIWFVSSLAIAGILQWHHVVRTSWRFEQVFLIDEILIIAPSLVSLLLSWLVFFELQNPSIDADWPVADRLRYLSIHCRVHLLLILVPIFLMVAVKDSWSLLGELPPLINSLMMLMTILTMLCLMPVIIKLIWQNRPVAVSEGRDKLLELCTAHHMRVNEVRVWETGGRVVNAVVTGIVPGFRLLMVSDLLLSSYPEHELRAILRHEAGHVRLRHLPIRIGFILLPALSLAAMELDPDRSLHVFFGHIAAISGFHMDHRLLLGLMFLVYILAMTAWLSRNMEIEADLYAIGACAPEGHLPSPVSTAWARALTEALLRFAHQHPDHAGHSSLTHPSLVQRIDMIRRASHEPQVASRFRIRFTLLQCLLAALIVATTIAFLAF